MTLEEREYLLKFLQRYPNVPPTAVLALFKMRKRYQEVKEGAKRAVETGVVAQWPPTGRGRGN